MAFTLFSDLLKPTQYVERQDGGTPTAAANTTNQQNTVFLAQANANAAASQPAPAAAHSHATSIPSSEAAKINEGIAEYLRNFITRRDVDYSGRVQIAESKRGGIIKDSKFARDGTKYAPYEIFRDIVSVRQELLEERIKQTVKVNSWLTSNGEVIPPDERWVISKENKIYNNLDNAVAAEVKRRHYARDSSNGIDPAILDKELNLAFKAVENEIPSRGGLINMVTDPFYNERDGIKLGGIGGAGAGLLMASMLIPDVGWLGNLAKVLFVFLGAYAGNKFVDSLPSSNRFASLATGESKQTEQSKGLVKEKEVATTPAQNNVAQVNLGGENIVRLDGGATVNKVEPQLFAALGNDPIPEKTLGRN